MSTESLPPDTPLLPPPPGEKSNFDNPESRSYQFYIVFAVCLVLLFSTMGCRVYVRLVLKHNWGLDDYMAALATICALIAGSLAIRGNAILFGYHSWDVRLSAVTDSFILGNFFSPITTIIGQAFVRLAVLTLYLRLFASTHPRLRLLVFLGIGVVVSYATATLISTIIYCVPRREDDGRLHNSDKCNDAGLVIGWVLGGFNIATDIYLLVIPIRPVKQLHVSRRMKLAIGLVFFTGSLACVCSIASVIIQVNVLGSTDYSWDAAPIYIVTNCEIALGTSCSCMPFVATVLRHMKGGRIHLYLKERTPPSLHLTWISAVPEKIDQPAHKYEPSLGGGCIPEEAIAEEPPSEEEKGSDRNVV